MKLFSLIALFILFSLAIYNFLVFYYNPLKFHALAIAIFFSASFISFSQMCRVMHKDSRVYLLLLTIINVAVAFVLQMRFAGEGGFVFYLVLGVVSMFFIILAMLSEAQ